MLSVIRLDGKFHSLIILNRSPCWHCTSVHPIKTLTHWAEVGWLLEYSWITDGCFSLYYIWSFNYVLFYTEPNLRQMANTFFGIILPTKEFVLLSHSRASEGYRLINTMVSPLRLQLADCIKKYKPLIKVIPLLTHVLSFLVNIFTWSTPNWFPVLPHPLPCWVLLNVLGHIQVLPLFAFKKNACMC